MKLNTKQYMEKAQNINSKTNASKIINSYFTSKSSSPTSTNSLNEIRQIIYFLYLVKEISKKVYKNIMTSIMV